MTISPAEPGTTRSIWLRWTLPPTAPWTIFFTQDDTSEFGFPNQEQHALREKISRLGLEDRALVYPGADEVGMVLVARHLNRIYNKRPRFFTRYSSVRGPLITALYEDRPLAESVKGQVFGSGGLVVDAPQDADIILMLNTPAKARAKRRCRHWFAPLTLPPATSRSSFRPWATTRTGAT